VSHNAVLFKRQVHLQQHVGLPPGRFYRRRLVACDWSVVTGRMGRSAQTQINNCTTTEKYILMLPKLSIFV